MNAIDIHTHAFPDSLAERAMQTIHAAGGCPYYGDGTVGGLLASMDAAGIDKALVCPIATRPGQVEGIVRWCKEIRSDRILVAASVHPGDDDPGAWVHRFAEEGFACIKLHPNYQAFAADDEQVFPIYQALAETGLILVSHCGLDFAFPDDDDRAGPERFARVLDRFGDLRLLATHMGGWRVWDDVDRLLIGRDIHLETSFSLARLDPDRAVAMIRRHGTEKVLFGTDWPWNDQAVELEGVRRLALSSEEIEGLVWRNAAGLMGLESV